MPEQTALDEIRDDAASRKRFLKMVGTGGAASLGLLLAACGADKKKTTSSGAAATGADTNATGSADGDIAIVNYALTLEYLEAGFYAEAIKTGFFKGSQLSLIKQIGEHEREHVDALTMAVKQLGGTPAEKPQTKFPLSDAKTIVKTAQAVENLGAAAYLGQAAKIKNKDILAAALSIHSVEARHAAALNTLVGKDITPDGAFAKPASMDEVLPVAKQFIVG
jgi:Ferritin-like domain